MLTGTLPPCLAPVLVRRYPSSVKLLRSYGRFLEEVKNDPWTAAKYYSEADKLEEQQENAANDAMLSDAVGDGDTTSMLAQVGVSAATRQLRVCVHAGRRK